MSPNLIRIATAVSAGMIAYFCVGIYALKSGIPPQSAYFGGFVAAIWCLMIFPTMGKVTMRDIYLICLTFPIVGATTGTFYIPFKGTYEGFEAALTLPIKTPWPVAAFYLLGGLIVFMAPRLVRARQAGPMGQQA